MPLHSSSVQGFVSAVQAVPLAFLASAGHALLVPLHVSARSQSPAADRHTVPFALNVQLAAQHELAVPFAAPSSHCSEPSTTPLPHAT